MSFTLVYRKLKVQCLGRKYKVAEEEKNIDEVFLGFSN